MNRSRNRAIFGVLFLVLLFFIILIVFAHFTMRAFQSEGSSSAARSRGAIGVIEVQGTIMEAKPTIDLLLRAEKEKNIKAIILRIDSPGGAVGPTQEIFQEMRRIDGNYAKKLAGEKLENEDWAKPIYASFGSIAASGGYYLGAGARRIYANPGTLTGSIGVIMQFMDLSKLYEFVKVNPNIIKAGRYKDIGEPARPMTREEEELMGGVLGTVHKQFVNDILLLRQDKIKGDIWELAQGQIFSGEEAHQHGLVDELDSLWGAGRAIHRELALEGEFELRFIRERKRLRMADLLDTLEQVSANLGLTTVTDRMPRLMFSR